LKGDDKKTNQKVLVTIVNLAENSVSEFITISTLDEKIKKEAEKSKLWSGRKLLQLTKIKDNETRVAKFLEFKAIIDKKLGRNVADSDITADKDDSS
jgi:hypothetical protein